VDTDPSLASELLYLTMQVLLVLPWSSVPDIYRMVPIVYSSYICYRITKPCALCYFQNFLLLIIGTGFLDSITQFLQAAWQF